MIRVTIGTSATIANSGTSSPLRVYLDIQSPKYGKLPRWAHGANPGMVSWCLALQRAEDFLRMSIAYSHNLLEPRSSRYSSGR